MRALDWFRSGDDTRARSGVTGIRQALAELEHAGYSREDLAQIKAVSGSDGKLYLQLPGMTDRAYPGGHGALPDALHLAAPYKTGPDLLRPRPLLRVIPGKLHGEPHIVGTRIPALTIGALDRAGYDQQQILAMYPDATPEALKEAIDFERALTLSLAA